MYYAFFGSSFQSDIYHWRYDQHNKVRSDAKPLRIFDNIFIICLLCSIVRATVTVSIPWIDAEASVFLCFSAFSRRWNTYFKWKLWQLTLRSWFSIPLSNFVLRRQQETVWRSARNRQRYTLHAAVEVTIDEALHIAFEPIAFSSFSVCTNVIYGNSSGHFSFRLFSSHPERTARASVYFTAAMQCRFGLLSCPWNDGKK